MSYKKFFEIVLDFELKGSINVILLKITSELANTSQKKTWKFLVIQYWASNHHSYIRGRRSLVKKLDTLLGINKVLILWNQAFNSSYLRMQQCLPLGWLLETRYGYICRVQLSVLILTNGRLIDLKCEAELLLLIMDYLLVLQVLSCCAAALPRISRRLSLKNQPDMTHNWKQIFGYLSFLYQEKKFAFSGENVWSSGFFLS
ncbi:hypothetical protein CISIN_1g042219mg [Citrus sinensis]|uniref:Uncharacterized protein n=1 Tax=Citrus sinensis TaxID=2711 RepID=A0A067H893_CITSI|nr:hypothetical protein CISIN_1g042219mg [Citrus sinensis]